jgi:hypothetical protein
MSLEMESVRELRLGAKHVSRLPFESLLHTHFELLGNAQPRQVKYNGGTTSLRWYGT